MGANQKAQKLLSTDLVNTYLCYTCSSCLMVTKKAFSLFPPSGCRNRWREFDRYPLYSHKHGELYTYTDRHLVNNPSQQWTLVWLILCNDVLKESLLPQRFQSETFWYQGTIAPLLWSMIQAPTLEVKSALCNNTNSLLKAVLDCSVRCFKHPIPWRKIKLNNSR